MKTILMALDEEMESKKGQEGADSMSRYVVEGIFLVETEAKDSREAQYKAKRMLNCQGTKIYVVNAWEKKEDEYEEEY